MPTPVPIQSFRASPLAVILSEGDQPVPKEVQVLKVGTFHDKRYGKFDITSEILVAMKENFDRDVRKLSLAMDYEHETEGVAAGWFQKVELKNNAQELWAVMDWTPGGQKHLADREYRYVSADFMFNYIDNETMAEHGPCLLGAALTNRPVIKGMDPITLTEGEGNMDPKDQMIQQLNAEIAKLKAQLTGGQPNPEMAQMQQQFSEAKKQLDDANLKLSEASKKIADNEAVAKKLEEEKKLSEKKAQFAELMKEGKAVKAQEDAFLKGDMDAFIKLSEKVNLDGKGNAGDEGGEKEAKNAQEAQAQVLKLAETKLSEEKAKNPKTTLTMDKAISLVLSEKTELAEKIYGKASV